MPPFAFSTLFWGLRVERMDGESYAVAQLMVALAAMAVGFLMTSARGDALDMLFYGLSALAVACGLIAAHFVTSVKRLRAIGLPPYPCYGAWFAVLLGCLALGGFVMTLFFLATVVVMWMAPEDVFGGEEELDEWSEEDDEEAYALVDEVGPSPLDAAPSSRSGARERSARVVDEMFYTTPPPPARETARERPARRARGPAEAALKTPEPAKTPARRLEVKRPAPRKAAAEQDRPSEEQPEPRRDAKRKRAAPSSVAAARDEAEPPAEAPGGGRRRRSIGKLVASE